MRKNYVLDANILLHDPNSIFNFADNTVVIPVAIVEEIDRFKKEMTDRGFNARAVTRVLDGLRGDKSLATGVPLPKGGMLKVYCDVDQTAPHNTNGDIEVLRVARAIQQDEPQTPVVIVTKDINLRIRADAFGLRAEDYETDHVRLTDIDADATELTLDPADLDRFASSGELPLGATGGLPASASASGATAGLPASASTGGEPHRSPGEYVLLRSRDDRKRTLLGRVGPQGDKVIALKVPDRPICGIRAKNKEQYYAFDALLDDSLQLVTLMGKAGTGKTLLTMAAAMHKTLVERAYRGILVARPIVPLGRDLGYLPGEIERKLEPWMKPITDTVDFILATCGAIGGHHDAAAMLRSGAIEIQPLAYIRGRSIASQFVVIDEAQNLTPLEVKTVITRIGQKAKVVLTGDPYQIDNPYVDASSNGFSFLVNRFHGQPMAAHVALHKGERSSLAELAANLL